MKKIIIILLICIAYCSPAFAGFKGFLRADTAVDVMVGPFIDDLDGKTAETGLTVTQAEVRLSKNGGNMAQKNESTSLTHDELGKYVCKLDATDTNTEGILTITIYESGALICDDTYMVMPPNAYDSFYKVATTDYLQVDAIQHIGTAYATPTTAGVPEVDITHVGGSGVPVTIATFASDVTPIATAATTIIDEFETQSQADPTGFHVNVKEVNGTAQTANDNGADINAILTDTSAMDTYAEMALLVWNHASTRALTELDEDNTTIDLDSTTVSATASASLASTTVASATDATTFVLTDALVVVDNIYAGLMISVTDADGDNSPEIAFVKQYTASTQTIILNTALSFTPANGDTVLIYPAFGRGSGVTLIRRQGL